MNPVLTHAGETAVPETFIHYGDNRGANPLRARHAVAFGASIAAHALAVLAMVAFAPRLQRPHTQWVLAYIVELGSNGGIAPKGNGGEVKMPSSAGSIASRKNPRGEHKIPIPSVRVAPALAGDPIRSHHRRHHLPEDQSAHSSEIGSVGGPSAPFIGGAPQRSVRQSGEGGGEGGYSGSAPGRGTPNGTVGGNGTGTVGNGTGAGDSSAHAEYGRNPPPPYPSVARRRAQQGTVMLRVLVAIDGAVKRVELLQSSGVDSLDDAAIETVRNQWRFVPARRDGGAIESWVVVPITFTLTDLSNNW